MSYANSAIEAMRRTLDELVEVTAQRDALLEACKTMLKTLDSLTTDEFNRGLDRDARLQMEAAVLAAGG